MLDDLLIRLGFTGDSLGERLRNVSPRHFPKKNQAWTAHKVRNRIAQIFDIENNTLKTDLCSIHKRADYLN